MHGKLRLNEQPILPQRPFRIWNGPTPISFRLPPASELWLVRCVISANSASIVRIALFPPGPKRAILTLCRLTQLTLARFMEGGHFGAHARIMRRVWTDRFPAIDVYAVAEEGAVRITLDVSAHRVLSNPDNPAPRHSHTGFPRVVFLATA